MKRHHHITHAAQHVRATIGVIRRALRLAALRLQQVWAAHCHLLRTDPGYVATYDSVLELVLSLAAAVGALHAAIRRLTGRRALP